MITNLYRNNNIKNPKNTKSLHHQLTLKIHSIIPLNIFQTWHSLELPEKMRENVELLKRQNPEFKHYLYDDNMCREFIKDNFKDDVLYSFDKLKPGAYKADLWRYCVLYINGGIYLDIKYRCVNGFKLIELTDKEYFVKDRVLSNIDCGMYNALMVCLPYNTKLLKTICNIVENVKNIFYDCNISDYRISSLTVTGPILLGNVFDSNDNYTYELKFSTCGRFIETSRGHVLQIYKEYHDDKKTNNKEYYTISYRKRSIYNFLNLKPVKIINLTSKITKFIGNQNVSFYTSNSCIVKQPDADNYIINIRWVNYSLEQNGSPIIKYSKNISLNSYCYLDNSFNRITDDTFSEDLNELNKKYKCYGIEDIRIFNYLDKFYYIGSAFNEKTDTISITSDIINFNNDNNYKLDKRFISTSFNDRYRIEKNWSFVKYNNAKCFVYQWHPLIICEIDASGDILNIVTRKYIKDDFFKKVKGSSSGVPFNNEIWFVLHINQDTNYQHFFAVFDNDMNLLRYSEPFKLDNSRVEYCIGLIIEENRTILSFTSLDTKLYIGIYDNKYINSIRWNII
jgi:mannosyltransferase OCH1-like enzyme